MSTELEKDIERKAVAAAKARGWISYKFVSPQQRGVPDRIFFREGKTVLIEFKRPGTGRLSKLQELQINRLREAGIPVAVCYSVNEAMEILG